MGKVRYCALVACLAGFAGTVQPVTAQVVIGGGRPDVEVDHSVLDRLGGELTLPDLFLGRQAAQPLATDGGKVRSSGPNKDGAHIVLHKPTHNSAPPPKSTSVAAAKPRPTASNKPAQAPPPAKIVEQSATPPEPSPTKQLTAGPEPKTDSPPSASAMAAAASLPAAPPTAAPPSPPATTPTASQAPTSLTPPKVEAPMPQKVELPVPAKLDPPPVAKIEPPASPKAEASNPPQQPPAVSLPVVPPPPPAVQPPPPSPVVEVPPAVNPAPKVTAMLETSPSTPPGGTSIGNDGLQSLLFDKDMARLPEETITALKRLATRMTAESGIDVQLLAYAAGDEDSASKARRLSLSRALAVRSFLMDQGIRSTRIEVRALGNKIPDNGPADRVDLVLQKH